MCVCACAQNTREELAAEFPKLQFRACPVDFSNDSYLAAIQDATKDVPIQLVFNNAGCERL